MTTAASPGHAASVWYFAYGSNLDPQTFLGRRRMRPTASQVATLSDYALTFDLAIGPGQRAVANLAPDPGGCVEGVAYRISTEQAAWLDRTEGVGRGAYRRIAVALRVGRDGELAAFSYLSERRVPGRRPSRRYMNLILRGARHHGLSPAGVAALRAIPLAVDERDPQLELRLGEP